MPARRPHPGSAVRGRGAPPARGTAAVTRLIAFAVPGLAGALSAELRSMPGVAVQDTGRDGRADVLLCTAEAAALRRVMTARLAEDVLVEVGRTLRSEGDQAAWISNRLWRPERVRRALAARARMTRPTGDRVTFRVIARVLQERSFLRSELRRQLAGTIGRQQPRWRRADPADVEVWVVEYQPGKIVAGLRVSDVRMRQHDGRDTERRGALRPTAAAAMVRLAGPPDGLLLDPCCGSGTILAEAARAGWRAEGRDIDPGAVGAARHNARDAVVRQGDVRRLDLADGSAGACVSNLPFGQQHTVGQDMHDWLRGALAELARVTQPGGRVVLLVPDIPGGTLPGALRLTGRTPIRLLGTKTTIWAYDRRR